MDLGALLMPGAQNIVTAMLGDAWTTTRDAIARRWGRGDDSATELAVAELDDSRSQALSLFSGQSLDEQIMRGFVAGYLAAAMRDRPERVDAIRALTEGRLLDGDVGRGGNHNTGQVTKLVQIDGNVEGGVHL
jgi:hypothetical protein